MAAYENYYRKVYYAVEQEGAKFYFDIDGYGDEKLYPSAEAASDAAKRYIDNLFKQGKLSKLGGPSMREQSNKIRSAGVEEPGKENERQAKGGETKTQQPKEEAEEKPNGLESSEPPNPDKQGAPGEEITEPPEPTKKDDAEMAKPPEAYMDPEDAQRIGGDPEKSEQFAEERNAEAEEGAPGVDQEMVEEMGPDKGLTDHLTEAFQNFLEPGKKQKTAQEHSEEIRRAGNEKEEDPRQGNERSGPGARERSS